MKKFLLMALEKSSTPVIVSPLIVINQGSTCDAVDHEPVMVISRLARENPSALLSISTKFGISVNVTKLVADVLGMLLYFKLIAIVMPL
jgi:hypothetical protein